MIEDLIGAATQFLTYGFKGPPEPAYSQDWQRIEQERDAARKRGWRDYYTPWAETSEVYEHSKFWIWRPEWNSLPVLVTRPHGLDPMMNVAGLLWKPYREGEAPDIQPTQLLLAQPSQLQP